MEKKQILLPSKRYFKANDEDVNLNVNLENEQSLLREGDMNTTINLQELFDKERNQSNQYKIYGKLKMVNYLIIFLGLVWFFLSGMHPQGHWHNISEMLPQKRVEKK